MPFNWSVRRRFSDFEWFRQTLMNHYNYCLIPCVTKKPTKLNNIMVDKFDKDDFNKLDSLLQVRHLIIHQDRFMGTETTVSDNIHFLKNLAEYIDNYIFEKYQKFS